VGDSTIREAITSEADLSRRISELAGEPVSAHLLVAGALGLWDSVCVTDCIRNQVSGLVVVEISPYNVAAGITPLRQRLENPRWPLDSSAFDDEATLAGLPTHRRYGNFFLDHYRFFVARPAILLHVIGGPAQEQAHFYAGPHWVNPEARAQAEARLTRWETNYYDNRGNNLEAYARLVRRVRAQPGISVALIEGVENPILQSHDAHESTAWAEYREDVRVFSARLPVQYWDLNHIAKLGPSDFVDLLHLNSAAAQERYTDALAHRCAAVLRDQTLRAGASL
jgi:hypothetical protein